MNKIRRMWENGRVSLLTPNGKALYTALCLESKWDIRKTASDYFLGRAVISMQKSTGKDIELSVSYWAGFISINWYGYSDIHFSFLDWLLMQTPAVKLYRNLRKAKAKSRYCSNSFIETCTKAAVTGDVK